MSALTTNLKLYKPEGDELVNEVTDLNNNWDIIDGLRQIKYKTADTSRVNNTVAADPHLAGYSVEANAWYRINALLVTSCASAVPDFRVMLASSGVPACTGTLQMSGHRLTSTVASPSYYRNALSLAGADIESLFQFGVLDAASTENSVEITAFFTSTSDFTFDVFWAQDVTTGGSAVTLETGSFLELIKVKD